MTTQKKATGPERGAAAKNANQQRHSTTGKRIDFAAINSAALGSLPVLLERWLPDGHQHGHEWVARNPKRSDASRGSFSINTNSGKWADFATGDKGGDVISLAAYLFNLRQSEAARELAITLGVSNG